MSKQKPPQHRRQCGTIAGANQHTQRGEQQCEQCRKTRRDYMRAYRAGEDLSRFRAPAPGAVQARHLREMNELMGLTK